MKTGKGNAKVERNKWQKKPCNFLSTSGGEKRSFYLFIVRSICIGNLLLKNFLAQNLPNMTGTEETFLYTLFCNERRGGDCRKPTEETKTHYYSTLIKFRSCFLVPIIPCFSSIFTLFLRKAKTFSHFPLVIFVYGFTHTDGKKKEGKKEVDYNR